MFNLLVYKFGFSYPSNVHLLTDTIGNSADNVSTQNVIDELHWLAREVRPGDIAVFYYAGHGSSDGFGSEWLVPHDERGMLDTDFASNISRIDTNKLLVVLDMSYSGGFITDGQTGLQGLLGVAPSWTDVAKDKPNGRVVLTACAQNIYSQLGRVKLNRDAKSQLFWHYDTGLRYEMVFTHYLSMGFLGSADSNGDGKVTVEEAFNFARSRAIFNPLDYYGLGQTPLMYDGYPAYGTSGNLYLG